MLADSFAIVGALIGSLGGFYYLYATITGRAQPNRVTWLLWGTFPMIIFVAQRVQGVEGQSWVSLVAGSTPLLIVGASLVNKQAYWKTERRDYVLMGAAILGIVLWAVTDNPNLALLFALLADILAAVPTLIKAYTHPASESWPAFAISAFGFGLSVLALQTVNFENAAFVVNVFLMNLALALLAVRGRNQRPTGGG